MSDKAPTLSLSPETMNAFLERAAKDPHFDVAKFQALLQEQRTEKRELQRAAYNRAMAAAQQEMELVTRDKPNAFLKSFYTSHRALYEAAHPVYTKNGFSVSYGTADPPHAGWLRVTMELAHKDGYTKERFLDAPLSAAGSQGGKSGMTAVQAVGATITYLRRYLLMMAFNLVPDERVLDPNERRKAGIDDDGEHQRRVYDVPEDRAQAQPAFEPPLAPDHPAGPVVYPSPAHPPPQPKGNGGAGMMQAFLDGINVNDPAGAVGGFLAALRARQNPLKAESLRRLAQSTQWRVWRAAQPEEQREALSAALDESIQLAEQREQGDAAAG